VPGGSRPFTLIVEDDASSREVLEEALVGDGHTVACASSGAEAIRLLETVQGPLTAVLLDLALPGLDGWAFHDWLRKQARFSAVPVVVVTGREPHLERFGDVPPAAVLHKPVQLDDVRQALGATRLRPPQADAPAQKGAGPRVLVVDDDADLRELTRDVLAEDGLAVSTARDGREAMEVLGREPVALVLLDLKMPHVDGWDVFVWLRGQPRLKDIPVVILSGSSPPQRTQEMLNRDLPFWVKKPIRPRDLLKLVRQHLALAPRARGV
jgi:CheY-like chemotaxis protein